MQSQPCKWQLLGVSWVTYLKIEKGIISNKSRVKIENFFRRLSEEIN